MLTKQLTSCLLLITLTSYSIGNVDPFFSKRTISSTPAPSPAPSPARPSTQPAPMQPKPSRPIAPRPTRPKPQQRTNSESFMGSMAEVAATVAPQVAVAAVAWYADARLYYIGAGIIGLSAAAYAFYRWNNQSKQIIAEPTPEPIVDDAQILFNACLHDNVQELRSVLDRNPSLIESLNHEGITPLIAASSQGSRKVVIELLNRNAKIDKVVHNGTTALKVAAAYGHVNVVKELIRRGASMEPNAQTPFSVLMVAVWHGQVEVVKILLEHGANLHTRVSFSAMDIAQHLMKTDLTPNERRAYEAIAHELSKR